MKTESSKFLEFNGKSIFFLSKDGQWWVAIKPICEAIGLEYTRQFKNLKESAIFARALANQPMHDTSGRLQKMASLPEKFVYGWLMSINSKNEDLISYQLECCEVLFDHFHGAITQRAALLKVKTIAQLRMEELEKKLMQDPEYKEYLELKKAKADSVKGLNSMDAEVVKNQLPLWAPEIDN